jgi:hypothetical protein
LVNGGCDDALGCGLVMQQHANVRLIELSHLPSESTCPADCTV